jgi:hypothetical protein
MKRCPKCKKQKSLSDFNKSTKRASQGWCRDCANRESREWYRKNKSRASFLRKQWANKHVLRDKTARKNGHLLRLYKISLAQFRAIENSQLGLCACCERLLKRPHVDHDHKTGKIRALLCGTCNTGIGHFGDDSVRCEKAAAYLRKHQTITTK